MLAASKQPRWGQPGATKVPTASETHHTMSGRRCSCWWAWSTQSIQSKKIYKNCTYNFALQPRNCTTPFQAPRPAPPPFPPNPRAFPWLTSGFASQAVQLLQCRNAVMSWGRSEDHTATSVHYALCTTPSMQCVCNRLPHTHASQSKACVWLLCQILTCGTHQPQAPPHVCCSAQVCFHVAAVVDAIQPPPLAHTSRPHHLHSSMKVTRPLALNRTRE